MRLKVTQAESPAHSCIVTSCAWAKREKQYELYSCGDDGTLLKSHAEREGAVIGKILDEQSEKNPPGFTCMQFLGDYLAVGAADGTVRFITNDREDKRIEAHRGAVTSLQWSYDETAILTTGEDGLGKIWSRSGMLRSTVAQFSRAIYCARWAPTGKQVVLCSGKNLHINSIQAGQKSMEWKADDTCVLMADWSPVNNLILSGGEDCKYKLWDSYGRLLFQSAPLEFVVSSIAWSPNGKYFAVGAYNMLKLCDRTGWCYSRESIGSSTGPQNAGGHTRPVGSLFWISWCPDGTQLAAGTGNGHVIFANLANRRLSSGNIDVVLNESNTVVLRNIVSETTEELDFRDRIIDLSFAYSILVVTTNNQCFIYHSNNWQSPHVEDLREPPTLIIQSPFHFALVDVFGINMFSYEGRQLAQIKYSGLRTEFLNPNTLSLSREVMCLVEPSNPNTIRFFDSHSNRALESKEHRLEVVQISLNQQGGGVDRRVAILDKNKDLYLCPAHKADFQKLCSMVDTFMWNDKTDLLIALSDQKLVCFFYPAVVFVDASLLPTTIVTKDCELAGKYATITSFSGSHVTLRKADGCNLAMMVSPYPMLLYDRVEKSQWDQAIRLCRYVKIPQLWAALAAMAIQARELNTLEIALAAIEEVDKVQFIAHLNKLPDEILKSAELSLFCKKPDEALSTLLQNQRTYRAIKMCIRLHRWDAALDLAVQYKTHIDTVLAYRQQHLEQMKREESNAKFKQFNGEVTVNWETVKQKITMEKENERRAVAAS